MSINLEILGYLWLFAALSLWLWLAIRFFRLPYLLSNQEKSTGDEPVSLIICFHNEEKNLTRLLSYWAEQEYGNFEVLLVDDHSTDSGYNFLESQLKLYPHLRLLPAKESDPRGKKFALQRGLAAAKYDKVVLCDADCEPASKAWLSALAAPLKDYDLVLGYGALRGAGFTGLLSDYETVQTALRYWSYALNGRPYMGVGRNMAYRKSVFHGKDSLSQHEDLLSGDDDLTVQLASVNKVFCAYSPQSFTYSPAPPSLKTWWQQKFRHYSTAWRYSTSVKFSLGTEGILQLAFGLLFPFALISLPLYITLSMVFLRSLFSGYLFSSLSSLIQRPKFTFLWIPLEMFWAFAATLLHLRNLFGGPPKKW